RGAEAASAPGYSSIRVLVVSVIGSVHPIEALRIGLEHARVGEHFPRLHRANGLKRPGQTGGLFHLKRRSVTLPLKGDIPCGQVGDDLDNAQRRRDGTSAHKYNVAEIVAPIE